MRHRRRHHERSWLGLTLPLALFFMVGGCTATREMGAPLARKRTWELFFNRGDSAAVADLYAPNADLVMSGAPPVRGRKAIRAAIDTMLRSDVKVRIDTTQSRAFGDCAYFYGPYTVLSSQQQVVEQGTYLEVWRRHGTRWLIDLDVNATGAPMNVTSSR